MRSVPNFVLYLSLIAVWFLLLVMAYCVKVNFPHPCVSRFVKLTNAVPSKRRAGCTGAQYTAAGGVFPPCARVTRSSRQPVRGPSCCDVSGFGVLRDGNYWFDVERFPFLMHVLVAHHRLYLLYVRGVWRHCRFSFRSAAKCGGLRVSCRRIANTLSSSPLRFSACPSSLRIELSCRR